MSSAIRSHAWKPPVESEAYDAGTSLIRTVDWEAVKVHCINLWPGQSCILEPEWNVGTVSLIRKIVFDDGVGWIVKLLLPLEDHDYKITPDMIQGLQSEMATMEYIRSEQVGLWTRQPIINTSF